MVRASSYEGSESDGETFGRPRNFIFSRGAEGWLGGSGRGFAVRSVVCEGGGNGDTD